MVDECEPYSKEACRASVTSLGLSEGDPDGYEFSDEYGTKGCYAYKTGDYAGMAFYGTDGTDSQMKEPLDSPKYRPFGYDCDKTRKSAFC